MADLEEAVIEKGTEVINFLREECRIPDEQCEQLEALITNTEDAKGWSPDGRELMERVEDVARQKEVLCLSAIHMGMVFVGCFSQKDNWNHLLQDARCWH